MGVLNKVKQIAKSFWGGKTKAQKRIYIGLATITAAILNAIFTIPVISFFISLILLGVSVGIIISSINDIRAARVAGKIDSTTEKAKTKNKSKKDKITKVPALSKKEQEQHDLAIKSRAEFEKLNNENKKVLDKETEKVMAALFDQEPGSASSVNVEEHVEKVEKSSGKSFDDVFKS